MDWTSNMTTLEDNTLEMLFQSNVWWWNPLHIHECSTLMFLDVSECACSVTSSGNEFHGIDGCHKASKLYVCPELAASAH